MISACAPPGGGRNQITPRLLRHMLPLSLPLSPANVLAKIFASILSSHFIHNNMGAMVPLGEALINNTITLFLRITK